jgi:TRAP-type C4-dicarboxylate transport system substrate-binding protein
VFWPRIQTVIINAKAYHTLTPAQRQILIRAGRASLPVELARISRAESAARALICTHGRLQLKAATPDDLNALRLAVQPLYDRLNRDPRTKAWIAGIIKTRQQLGLATDTVTC